VEVGQNSATTLGLLCGFSKQSLAGNKSSVFLGEEELEFKPHFQKAHTKSNKYNTI